MRREWHMVLLAMVLLVPVGCGTTAKASVIPEEEPAQAGALSVSSETYTVQSGDTLMGISRKLFNGDAQYWDEIANLNDLKAPYTIYPGKELKIPKKATGTTQTTVQSQAVTTPPRTYKVQSGDCLMGIARKLLGDPQRWREIANLNGIGPPYTIHPGDELKLP